MAIKQLQIQINQMYKIKVSVFEYYLMSFVSHCVELSDSDEIPSLQQSGSLDNKEIEEKEDIQQLRNQSEQLKKEKDDLEKRISSIFIEKEDEREINRLRDEELKNLKISYQQYMNGISSCCSIK